MEQSQQNLVAMLIFIGFLATIPLLTQGNQQVSPSPSSGGDTKGRLAHYTLASLKAESTAIVLGRPGSMLTVYGLDQMVHFNTVFEFNVERYIAGGGQASFNVADRGGTLGSLTESVEGSPLLVPGQSYILFLSNEWDCAPSPPSSPCLLPPTPLHLTFRIVGGPQGKFLVVGDLVYGFKTLFPDVNYAFEFDANGLPMDQFISMVLNG